MTSKPSRPRLDDAQLDTLLSRSSGHRAPADLVANVMAAARAEAAAIAWWRQPLPEWPRPALAAGLAATAAVGTGLAVAAERWLGTTDLTTGLPSLTPAWLGAFATLRDSLWNAGGAVLRSGLESLASPLVIAAAAVLGASALLSAGFGFATLHLANATRHPTH